jgi:hypothetical protein
VLSPSLYRLSETGEGLEFAPETPGISDKARAELALGQRDGSVAEFLREGQSRCESSSAGAFPRFSSRALDVAASPAHPWCGGSVVSGSATVGAKDPNPFVTTGVATSARFTSTEECSPFFGPEGRNDFLIARLAKVTTGDSATYSLALDPIPYTIPADCYDANNNLCGPSAYPFVLSPSQKNADPYHAGHWAAMNVNGNCEWGTFSNCFVVQQLGVTVCAWVLQYSGPGPCAPSTCQ